MNTDASTTLPPAKPARAIGTTDLVFFDGMMTFQASIIPVKKSEAGLKIVCPACTEAVKADQRYICSSHPDEHGPYAQDETHRAILVDDILRKVTAEEIITLKAATIPAGEAVFTVYHAHELEASTMPSGSIYRLRPKTGMKLYSMLVDMLRDDSLAYVCEMTFKGGQKMYRCISRDGMLWLRELIRPAEFHPTEQLVSEYPGALLEKASELATMSVQTFVPENYANVQRQRLADLEAIKRDPNAPTPPPVLTAVPIDEADDLLALLQATIDAKVPKKAPAAKRAPAKRKPKVA